MKGTVLIPQDVAEIGKRYLEEHGYRIKLGCGVEPHVLRKEIAECDAILVRTAVVDEALLDAAPRLKVIAKHGIGVDNIDTAAAEARGIYVTNAPLSNAVTVAEHTIGVMLALARRLIVCDRAMRAGQFDIRNELRGSDLEGKTLGLVGVGRIGTAVARIAARGLGMKVMGYDPYASRSSVAEDIELMDDWEQLFRISDYMSLHVPLTSQTRRLVGAREFAWMKPTACLLNASRGETVDEPALIEALRSGTIAGAALDVFEEEPPAPGHPLFAMDNVIVTPHNAALTHEAVERMALHAAMSIVETLGGHVPSWPLNKPIAPRALQKGAAE